MEIISVNLGTKKTNPNGKAEAKTGIYKLPVSGSAEITPLGLDGDVIISTKHHGGLDQAVYIYGSIDYDWWERNLGRKLEPGNFGENLTIRDLESASFQVGDRLFTGSTVLEVTAPRIPCATFAGRMEDPQWVKKFRDAVRPGLYCRVIQPGTVCAGDTVRMEAYPGETVTIREMFNEWYTPETTEAGIRRYLDAPIAERSRKEKQKQLEKLLQSRVRD